MPIISEPENAISNQMNETQRELRERYAALFATVWTGSSDYLRESAQMEIDQTFKTDRAINHTISKLGYIPKFPTADKAAMEREAMEMLTAFRVILEAEDLPTLKEAMEDPHEYLMGMAETLLMDADPAAGERGLS